MVIQQNLYIKTPSHNSSETNSDILLASASRVWLTTSTLAACDCNHAVHRIRFIQGKSQKWTLLNQCQDTENITHNTTPSFTLCWAGKIGTASLYLNKARPTSRL